MTPEHDIRIALNETQFGAVEREIANFDGLRATGFRFASGVAALRITGAAGEIVTLPFQGQQIWDAIADGRRLTMQTRFDQPLPTREYLETYGAFLIHCGAWGMGNPGAEDSHALHGELPNAQFEHAWLLVGGDSGGAYMALSGAHEERRAFSYDYAVRPEIKMYRDLFSLEVRQKIFNLRHTPMTALYLLHLNFRPVEGARLVDTVRDDAKDLRLRDEVPAGLKVSNKFLESLDAERRNPGHHRSIREGETIEPELVMSMAPAADEHGWAHIMHCLPDGRADFVSYRPEELGHAVRWMVRSPEMQALGMCLPATARPDGREAALKAGEGAVIAPGKSFECTVRCGALSAAEALALEQTCISAKSAQAGFTQ